MMQKQSPVQRLIHRSLLMTVVALCMLLATSIVAQANTVRISDAANVLNVNQVQSEAANLPDPIDIYTTSTFNGTTTDLENRAHSHITSQNLIVMVIDTKNHHLAIVGGANVPLSSSQYQNAVSSFISAYKSNGNDYSASTIAAISTMRSSLGAQPSNGNNNGTSNGNVPTSATGGLFSGLFGTLCCIGLFILIVGGIIFAVSRRRSFARRGMGVPLQQNYQQPYSPMNQGYPPNYGPGYNQGSGMNPWAAGGLGAAAGGLIGYELGKEQGEDQGQNQGNWGGGGGDFGGGAGGDFGGGGGGDFGGGAGGDFGGGGGGDFGGGGGGDFGGGGGGGGSF